MKIPAYFHAFLCSACCLGAKSAGEPVKPHLVQTAVTGQPFVADFYYIDGLPRKLGILFLGGSEGGKPYPFLPKYFANRGYPVLGLAYFKSPGLPDRLEMIPLEYFDKAISWMEDNKSVRPGGIVVYGGSRGAEAALLLASRHPDIIGVIALAPSSVVWQASAKDFWLQSSPKSSWSSQGYPVPFVPYDLGKYHHSSGSDPIKSLAVYNLFKGSLEQKEAVTAAAIEVEKIHGPILLLSGRDDRLWPSPDMADAICERLKSKGFRYKFESMKYDAAGHNLNERFNLGGTPEGNRKAVLDASKRMLEFLDEADRSSASAAR